MTRGKTGETYCVGGLTQEISNLEIVKKIIKLMGKEFEDSIQYVQDRPGHDRRYAVDWSKIHAELGWEPTVDLETGLKKTIDWFQGNEDWWKKAKSTLLQNAEYTSVL